MSLNPPFTNLPSFNATAMIISYAVARENARQLIMRLSKNSIGYYYKHKLILKEFLADNFRLTRTLEFGCLKQPWKHEYPTNENFEELKKFISGKTVSGDCLCENRECVSANSKKDLRLGRLSSVSYVMTAAIYITEIGFKYSCGADALTNCKLSQ